MRFAMRVLGADPIGKLFFKFFLARSQAAFFVIGFKRLVMFCRQNNGIELTCFFNEDGLALGLSGKTTESVLSFCGCNAHDGLLK